MPVAFLVARWLPIIWMTNINQENREKPRIFVGSSAEKLFIANNIQLLLEHDAEVTVWTQGIFQPSNSTLEDLIELLDRIDFGVFVFTPDDISNIRKKSYSVARDNVIFEMGLFIGRLGKKRTFYIVPRSHEKLHLPSDLIGVNPLDYNDDRSDGNIQAALGSPCTKLIVQMKKLGRFESEVPVLEHRTNQGTSVFTKQEDIEFNYIYEILKPFRYASVSVLEKDGENKFGVRNEIGKCIFKYSLIKVIWLNISQNTIPSPNFCRRFGMQYKKSFRLRCHFLTLVIQLAIP